MAKKVRPGVGAPGAVEAGACDNNGNHPARPQPQGQAKNAALSAALDYAAAGLRVFPCLNNPGHKNHKKPLTKNGFKDASCDLARVDQWWQQWPNALIGIPTASASVS
jgi:putative DNA primase/helicase